MPDQNGEKRHEATPYRRQKAREQGQIARSQDLASAFLLLVAVGFMWMSGHQFSEYFTDVFREKLGAPVDPNMDGSTAAWMLLNDTYQLSKILLPAMGALMLAALAVNIGQTGFLFLPDKLTMDIKRLNPIAGVKRIVSITSFMRLLFGLIKVAIVVGVAIASLWNEWESILGMAAIPFHEMCVFLVDTALLTVFKIGGALFILALIDYLFQRWKMEKDLMMTDDELRQEVRTLNGDPHIIARRRVIQRQLALNRMSNVVPNADFVATNPTELAIAIKYDMETMPTPVVIAKGAGLLAQRIRRIALENDVPIVERKELARALYEQVDVNQPIPSEQYATVAEILRYVYELKGKTLPQQAAA